MATGATVVHTVSLSLDLVASVVRVLSLSLTHSADALIRRPPVSTVDAPERSDDTRSLRIALSRAVGGCAEFAHLAGGCGRGGAAPPPALAPARALRCAHEAIEEEDGTLFHRLSQCNHGVAHWAGM